MNVDGFARGMRSERIRAIAIVGAGSVAAYSGISTMPFQVGALIDGVGIGIAGAAIYASLAVLGLALAMIAITPWIAGVRIVIMIVPGLALGSLANLAIFILPVPVVIFGCGLLGGVGCGLVFAGSLKLVARYADKHVVLPLGTGVALTVIITVIYCLPATQKAFGLLAPFLLLTMLIFLASVLICALGRGSLGRSVLPEGVTRAGRPDRRLALADMVIVGAWCLFAVGNSAPWTFVERIGRSIGMGAEDISTVISLSTIFGIGGTLLVPILSRALGSVVALVASLAVNGVAAGVLVLANDRWIYAATVATYSCAQMAAYAGFMNVAAPQDESGRLVTFGNGLGRLGTSFGTFFGGLLVATFSYRAAGLFAFCFCFSSAGLMLWAAMRYPRSEKRAWRGKIR